MSLKLDENLRERLVSELQALGHDVDTVRTGQLAGHNDTAVGQAAQSAGRFLITQDLDFSDLRHYVPGTHAGLLLLRLARPGRDALLSPVSMLFATESVEKWWGCLVVATDHKIRILIDRKLSFRPAMGSVPVPDLPAPLRCHPGADGRRSSSCRSLEPATGGRSRILLGEACEVSPCRDSGALNGTGH